MTTQPAPSLSRCQWCGDMFLTEQARNWHEPKCDDNPNYTPPPPED